MSTFVLPSSSSLVAVAGDWEANAVWAVQKVNQVADLGADTVLHVGDFSLYPGPFGKKFVLKVQKACAERKVVCYVTPGNHEDWGRLYSKGLKQKNEMGPLWWISDNIAFLPPGHRFSLVSASGVSRSVLSVGGAPSINFKDLTQGREWWPQEVISDSEASLSIQGGLVDLMISHDSPLSPFAVDAVQNIRQYNPLGFSAAARAYAHTGAVVLDGIYKAVQPSVLFHGHYHCSGRKKVVFDSGRHGEVVALAAFNQAGNIGWYNVAQGCVAAPVREQ